jgi:predicted AAA+ superfamily ATPase
MARSNREYVGTALEVLAQALDPFIERTLASQLPADHPAAADWTKLLSAKDATHGRAGGDYERTDPQLQFRVITEAMGSLGYVFNGALSRAEQSLASELRATRNDWAHNKPFTSDQARRALDTTELLLRAAGAVQEADEVKAMRLEVQRTEYERDTRKTVRTRNVVAGAADNEVPSWRDVLPPHRDVAEGRFAASQFAADLYSVAFPERASTQADTEYADPVEYFRRTYLTEGLRELLRRAAARVGGNMNADAVINLQTTFGGGKTHSMLAVWHLFSGTPVAGLPQEVQDVVGPELTSGVRRVAIVGNEIAPARPDVKPDGTVVRTLWGELAWQLGGAAGYAHVAEADETGTNPGAGLRSLLAAHSPAVILVDEWVSYARALNQRVQRVDGSFGPLPAGDFETQFTFAQTLTEAVKATPGALLLVSVPASDRGRDDDGEAVGSDLEVGGEFGREALARLDNVIRRVAYQWAPASQDESYEIVRRRLFQPVTDERARQIATVARHFKAFYEKHIQELPNDVATAEYEARIRASYPIHPELLDRLYAEWSTLEKFQRTRGVLRLMSEVVHQLWLAGDPAPLILPASVPLGTAGIRREVVQYLSPAWDAIIQSDIDSDGDGAIPVARAVDAERHLLGDRQLTTRTARAVFVQSAPTTGSHVKGVGRKRLLLGMAQPGDVVGNVGSALQALADRSSHFYVSDGRYWYDTQKSLNREVAERAKHLPTERIWEEVVTRLRKQAPRATPELGGVIIAESTGDVPEDDSVRLVLVHPRYRHTAKDLGSPAGKFALEVLKTRGTAPRALPNTVILLAADARRWDELESTTRSYLAWASVLAERKTLDLTESAVEQAERSAAQTNRTVDDQIAATWTWGLHAVQPVPSEPLRVSQVRCDGGEKRLAQRVGAKFVREDQLRVQTDPKNIWLDLNDHLRARWNTGSISVGELWGYYTRYPYLPRLRDRSVLLNAIQDALFDAGFSKQGFALATGYDHTTGVFSGLAVPVEDTTFGPITDDTLLVRSDLAIAQRMRERADQDANEAETGADGTPIGRPATAGHGTTSSPSPVPLAAPPVQRVPNARYSGAVDLDTDGDLRKTLTTLVDELLRPLQGASPEVLEIKLQVTAEKADGFGETVVRTVRENGPSLGVDGTFEEG